ncbi:hypothetical protein PSYJYH_000015 [Bacillus phage PSYJ-YH]|nr:hypothetical protein PSYJYH_000015 [Bacillus phage PSYJ-YH]
MSAIGWTLLKVIPIGFALLFASKGIAKKMDEKGMWN